MMPRAVSVAMGLPTVRVEVGVPDHGVGGRVRELDPGGGEDEEEQGREQGERSGLHARSIAPAPSAFKGRE